MPENEYLRIQEGQVKNRKLNPIFSSVPSLWLQSRPQIHRMSLLTFISSLVNIIGHQELAARPVRKWWSLKGVINPDLHVVHTTSIRNQWFLGVWCRLVAVKLPVDAELCVLLQQVCVDQCFINCGVHWGLVVCTRFRESFVSWQDIGAIWIIDGRLMIQLFLLPVWIESYIQAVLVVYETNKVENDSRDQKKKYCKK